MTTKLIAKLNARIAAEQKQIEDCQARCSDPYSLIVEYGEQILFSKAMVSRCSHALKILEQASEAEALSYFIDRLVGAGRPNNSSSQMQNLVDAMDRKALSMVIEILQSCINYKICAIED